MKKNHLKNHPLSLIATYRYNRKIARARKLIETYGSNPNCWPTKHLTRFEDLLTEAKTDATLLSLFKDEALIDKKLEELAVFTQPPHVPAALKTKILEDAQPILKNLSLTATRQVSFSNILFENVRFSALSFCFAIVFSLGILYLKNSAPSTPPAPASVPTAQTSQLTEEQSTLSSSINFFVNSRIFYLEDVLLAMQTGSLQAGSAQTGP
ncbi:hypothetical protein COTS27_01582 [Spirochaetota bacterium]|nr:hypothetical protein COTS27_01582 [Spirochaetota bacterium]